MLVANPAKAKESDLLNGHAINTNNNSMKTTEMSSYSNGTTSRLSQAKLSSEIKSSSSSLFQQTNKEIRSSKLGAHFSLFPDQSKLFAVPGFQRGNCHNNLKVEVTILFHFALLRKVASKIQV
jgi:hypothetical protein